VILVLGASGYTGLAVTRALVARGKEVRGLVRRQAATAEVRSAGASDVVVADVRDLDAVETAARGADGIFFIGPRFLPEEAALGKAVIDIAERLGVRRFVLSGVYHPTIRGLVNHQAKADIEDHLYESDLEFAVLQPARYMHGLLLSSWERLVTEGVLADAFATDAAMAYVDYTDVAEVAALAFSEDRLVGGTFELASEGQHTVEAIAAVLGPVFGRSVRAERVPLAEYGPARALLANPYSADGFRRLRRYYDAHGFHGGNALVLRTILGREPTTFAECAATLQREGTGR
jgi:uncharacterized protein YbjT (DUF2867 family)